MGYPVLLALVLPVAVAALVFVGSRPRVGTWLQLAAIGLLIGGAVLWAHEPSHRHTTVATPASVPHARLIIRVAGQPPSNIATPSSTGTSATVTFVSEGAGRRITTGSGPNHTPALALLGAGGMVGLLGIGLNRRKAIITTHDNGQA